MGSAATGAVGQLRVGEDITGYPIRRAGHAPTSSTVVHLCERARAPLGQWVIGRNNMEPDNLCVLS